MTKSISCKDAEKDCTWSASTESITELMSKVMIHVLTEHKEIELNPENIAIIKSQIKTKIFKDGVRVESGRFWWWGEKMEKVNKLIADEKVRLQMVSFELNFPKDFKVDKPSIDKLIADFQELSLKLSDSKFEISNMEIKQVVTIYMKYYEKAGKLTTKEESHDDNIFILTSILKLREGIMSMVALITSKLIGKLENEITELKKNQKPVNNTKKKSKKKSKK